MRARQSANRRVNPLARSNKPDVIVNVRLAADHPMRSKLRFTDVALHALFCDIRAATSRGDDG